MKKSVTPRFAPIPAAIREAEEEAARKRKAKDEEAARQAKAKDEEDAQLRQAVANTKAVDVFNATHPAHDAFVVWLDGKLPTKRKAREFYRTVQRAA